MNEFSAKQFILENARPVDLAVYKYFFENKPKEHVIRELSKYQNSDGGFGHGLEPDYWNPHSSPIATNDAIITLYRIGALNRDLNIISGIVHYLNSYDSFNIDKKRWLFAIDSNKNYPHAIWWEKENDGISGFNPTMSLAAFSFCYCGQTKLNEEILKEGILYLEKHEEISGDALKCYLLAYELLQDNHITDLIDLNHLKTLLSKRIYHAICKNTQKYGVEYVPMPSDFFCGIYSDFITSELQELVDAEKEILGNMQKEDGGFDISWKWGTDYSEFEQARSWWRPRLTLDFLLF